MTYTTTNWLKLCFKWKGTVLPKIWLRIVLIMIIGILLKIIREQGYELIAIEITGHALIGIALGLLIVFRNNSAYDRWYEGRRAWGRLFTITQDLMRMGAIYGHSGKEFSELCTGYVISLKHLLQKTDPETELQHILPEPICKRVLKTKDVPYAIATEISSLTNTLLIKGVIDTHQVVRIEQIVSDLVSARGICMRIQKTPIPFCYSVHLHQMLYLYVFSFPFAVVPMFGWMGILLAAAIASGLIGIEEAGVEIEEPFGFDMNDLPMDIYCKGIAKYVYDTAKLAQEVETTSWGFLPIPENRTLSA